MRAIIAAFICLSTTVVLADTRVKDITTVRGVRDNQLVGYGLVFGLNGTGDSLRNAPFTDQSMQSMLDRLGVNIRGANQRSRNVAAVIVTADLPAFAGAGTRLDVTISSVGDASSLLGGTLVMTPLSGADGQVYAVAQGQLAVSGFAAKGKAESLTQGVPTTGRIPNGAIVEKEVANEFNESNRLFLELRNPDFSTAVRISDAINEYANDVFKMPVAREIDSRTVALRHPSGVSAARFLADVGELRVDADTPARIVVDQRSGTIVLGGAVRISPVAITQGNITVRITEEDEVSQPAPFSDGRTVVVPRTSVVAKQEKGKFAILRTNNLDSLVKGLNSLGLKPADVILILQAVKSSGAIQAELVVQ